MTETPRPLAWGLIRVDQQPLPVPQQRQRSWRIARCRVQLVRAANNAGYVVADSFVATAGPDQAMAALRAQLLEWSEESAAIFVLGDFGGVPELIAAEARLLVYQLPEDIWAWTGRMSYLPHPEPSTRSGLTPT